MRTISPLTYVDLCIAAWNDNENTINSINPDFRGMSTGRSKMIKVEEVTKEWLQQHMPITASPDAVGRLICELKEGIVNDVIVILAGPEIIVGLDMENLSSFERWLARHNIVINFYRSDDTSSS